MNKYLKYSFYIILTLTAVMSAPFVIYKKNRPQVAGIQTQVQQTPVRGIILPHHDLADELIVKSFERIANEHYSYIVIFGPNHFVPEVNSVVSAREIPDYTFNSEVMDKFLITYPDVLLSEEITSKEHSITLYLPYIKHYYPEAKILPFILSPFASKNETFDKVNWLTSHLPDDTLYIAGVDFAHNTMVDAGINNNEESIEAIRNLDIAKITNYTDDHMDSPLSITALIAAMQNVNMTDWETWYNSHSALIKQDLSLKGTSYVIGVFR